MINIKPIGTVLRYNKKRYLKIPKQFDKLSHGDTAIMLTCETDDYIEIIYKFKIEDLKLVNKIEQKRLKQAKIDDVIEKLRQIEIEKLKNQNLCEYCCEYCNKPLNKKVITFVNIEQNPIHYFCSRNCKFKWIYSKQKE